jgi:hypothetical protein
MSKHIDLYQPPFRWNIQRRSEMGGLLDGPPAPSYPGFLDDLLPCCARIIGFAGDSDLYFVGRSPESLFDHLSGLLLDSSWADRPRLLHFSMRWTSETWEGPNRDEAHLKALRLAVSIFDAGRTRERRLAFARALSQERAMRHPWFRTLTRELGN